MFCLCPSRARTFTVEETQPRITSCPPRSPSAASQERSRDYVNFDESQTIDGRPRLSGQGILKSSTG
jgi:hypothetical protein